MKLFHEAYRQDTIRWTKSRLCLCSIENNLRHEHLHSYSHLQCMDLDRRPRKVDKTIISGINPRAVQGRHGWNLREMIWKLMATSLVYNRTVWCWAINPKIWHGYDNQVAQPTDTQGITHVKPRSKYIQTY